MQQGVQRRHGAERHRQHHEALRRDDNAEEHDVVGIDQSRKRLRLGAVEILGGLFQEQRQRDGGDHERQDAVAQHRVDDDLLEQDAQDGDRENDADQARRPERQPQHLHGRQDEECRQHDELALGEVDGLGGLPDQREADRHQGVNRPGSKTGNQKLDEGGHENL